MGRKLSERGKPPRCHPDRPYFANGLCNQCEQQRQRKENPARKNLYNRNFSRSRPDKVREYQRRYAYGLEPEEYKRMLAAQGSCCFICERCFEDDKKLCVDHCHTTGAVRALLCKFCNVVVGMAEKYPKFLANLAIYIEVAEEEKKKFREAQVAE